MKVLLTGGLGYIGSHTAIELVRGGHEICIIDNLSNSEITVLERLERLLNQKIPFVNMDICNKKSYDKLEGFDFDTVIHFAAKKSISESLEKPLAYYHTNITGLLTLLQFIDEKGISKLVFSSSCTVYGLPHSIPVSETETTKESASPYGNTKRWAEEMLMEFARLNQHAKIVLLRYFNPVGADKSGKIGELPRGLPDNLMPFITQTAVGIRPELLIYGADYATPDGTAIRDYIHVSDLAKAHIAALEYMIDMPDSFDVFNIGTGHGISVLEMVQAFEQENRVALKYRLASRRPGDLEQIWAETEKAKTKLNWKPEFGLKEMVTSAWKWQLSLKRDSTI